MERKVLITGASRGIGAGIANAAARRGWTNLLVSRDSAAMKQMIDKWKAAGNGKDHAFLAQDLAAPGSVASVAAWLDKTGYPDVVIHNAAVGAFGPFAETALQKHADTIALGVRVTVELTHALLQKMPSGGRSSLVYIGSTSGRKPVPFMTVYSSTKAFIHQFTYALREELCGRAKVLLVIPGAVKTDFPAQAGLPPSFTAKGLDPQDVGEAIAGAIEDGKDGVITLGSRKERFGGWMQRILPPSFWARKMRKSYERMLHHNSSKSSL